MDVGVERIDRVQYEVGVGRWLVLVHARLDICPRDVVEEPFERARPVFELPAVLRAVGTDGRDREEGRVIARGDVAPPRAHEAVAVHRVDHGGLAGAQLGLGEHRREVVRRVAGSVLARDARAIQRRFERIDGEHGRSQGATDRIRDRALARRGEPGHRHQDPCARHGGHLARPDGNLFTVSSPDRDPAALRLRREPPHFRRVEVQRTANVSPRLLRVTLAGAELAGFTVDLPAASVRLLLPAPGVGALVMPTWNGNEFLLPDGTRPAIRTFTPRRFDPVARELDVDVVVHGGGAASEWAVAAAPGDAAAVSGPGRGYSIAADAPAFVLAGDETAIPAMSQLLEVLPATTPVTVYVEIADSDARHTLPQHPRRNRHVVRAGRRDGARRRAPRRTPRRRHRPGRACGSPAKRRESSASAATSSRIARLHARGRRPCVADWKHGRAGADEDA